MNQPIHQSCTRHHILRVLKLLSNNNVWLLSNGLKNNISFAMRQEKCFDSKYFILVLVVNITKMKYSSCLVDVTESIMPNILVFIPLIYYLTQTQNTGREGGRMWRIVSTHNTVQLQLHWNAFITKYFFYFYDFDKNLIFIR